jgi:hypothetical protein
MPVICFTIIAYQDMVKMYVNTPHGTLNLYGKTLKDWFKTVSSMAFYIALFSGIGYLIRLTLL